MIRFPAREAALGLVAILWASGIAFAQGSTETPHAKIDWTDDLPAALDQGRREHKPIVVCFVAGWCSACAGFERGALRSPLVNGLADRFVWVKLDVERAISLVKSYDIRATPRIDLLDPSGRALVRISGALPPADFVTQLDLVLEELRTHPTVRQEREARAIDGSQYTPLTETPDGYRGLSLCYSNIGYGPLRVSSQSPFQSLRIGLVPRTPSTLGEGQAEIHWNEAYSNVFIKKEGEYLLQFDLLQSSLGVSYGVTDTFEVDLEFDDKSRFGGFMDQFIQHFHHAFGLPNQLRNTEPDNAFAIQFPANQNHPAVDLGNRWRGAFSDSIALTLQENLTCGTDRLPAFSFGLTLRTEPGGPKDLQNELPVDPAFTASLAKRVGDFYFYAEGLVSYYGHDRFHGLPLRAVQLTGLLAVEWRFDDNASMVLQYQISEGVAERLGPFSRPASEVAFGWKIEVLRNTLLELGAIHTLLNNENSMDFGFTGGLTYRF